MNETEFQNLLNMVQFLDADQMERLAERLNVIARRIEHDDAWQEAASHFHAAQRAISERSGN